MFLSGVADTVFESAMSRTNITILRRDNGKEHGECWRTVSLHAA